MMVHVDRERSNEGSRGVKEIERGFAWGKRSVPSDLLALK